MAAKIRSQDCMARLRAEIRRVFLNCLYSTDQFPSGVGLKDQPFCTHLDRGFDRLFRIVDGQEKDLGLWKFAKNLARRFQAVKPRHSDVESDYFRIQFARFL